MSWIEAAFLGLIQGLTEFLPISSDGHLVITEGFLATNRGQSIPGSEQLFFYVMLHLGTLAAILIYYRQPAATLGQIALGQAEPRGELSRASIFRATFLVGVATLPAVVVGLFFKEQVERATGMPWMAGPGFVVTAVALLLSLRLGRGTKSLGQTRWYDALLIGTVQAIAVLPGVSRSGMTITMALALGLSRTWAVTFSLLMAIPAILGAGVLEIGQLDPTSLTTDRVLQTALGMLVAGLVGYLAIVWLFRIVQTNRLWYFSVYLLFLAVVVLLNFPIRGGVDDGPARATSLDGTAGITRVEPDRPLVRSLEPRLVDRSVGLPAHSGASGMGFGSRGSDGADRLDLGGALGRGGPEGSQPAEATVAVRRTSRMP